MIHTCGGQTDDGRTGDSIYSALSICCRALKTVWYATEAIDQSQQCVKKCDAFAFSTKMSSVQICFRAHSTMLEKANFVAQQTISIR